MTPRSAALATLTVLVAVLLAGFGSASMVVGRVGVGGDLGLEVSAADLRRGRLDRDRAAGADPQGPGVDRDDAGVGVDRVGTLVGRDQDVREARRQGHSSRWCISRCSGRCSATTSV